MAECIKISVWVYDDEGTTGKRIEKDILYTGEFLDDAYAVSGLVSEHVLNTIQITRSLYKQYKHFIKEPVTASD